MKQITTNIIQRRTIMLTKGKMINELKKAGIRTGEKNGAAVGLSHLKAPQITVLYYRHCTNKD